MQLFRRFLATQRLFFPANRIIHGNHPDLIVRDISGINVNGGINVNFIIVHP